MRRQHGPRRQKHRGAGLSPSRFSCGAQIDINDAIDYPKKMQASDTPMDSITIRLDPAIKERLGVRAAESGHSVEAEARHILQAALGTEERGGSQNLYERVRARFASLDGVELDLPTREPVRDPPRFG